MLGLKVLSRIFQLYQADHSSKVRKNRVPYKTDPQQAELLEPTAVKDHLNTEAHP